MNLKHNALNITALDYNCLHKPDKYLTNLSIAELKLGQFARAIIGRPRILLLDSFFKDVDKSIQKKINYLILALKKIGTTVIIFGESPDDNSISFNKIYEIYNKNLEER